MRSISVDTVSKRKRDRHIVLVPFLIATKLKSDCGRTERRPKPTAFHASFDSLLWADLECPVGYFGFTGFEAMMDPKLSDTKWHQHPVRCSSWRIE